VLPSQLEASDKVPSASLVQLVGLLPLSSYELMC
jgi:hypothetical protein